MDKLIIDMHTHSSYSPDADDSAEAMYQRAVDMGLKAYALTDHCDVNFWEDAPSEDTVDAMMYGAGKYAPDSIAAQTRLKEKFSGKLDIAVGIELAQPMQAIGKAELIAADERLDFIIGSHHMNRGVDDFYYLDYSKMSFTEIDDLMTECFIQTLEMCSWGKFDVLGHLTYPLRYICGEYGINVDIYRYEDVIREIFCTLISKGKGIEINTSGLRQKYGKTFPSFELVKLYRQLGGEIITVGSDAHRCEDLAKGTADGIELAKAAGFGYTAFYKKHEPKFLKL